MPYMTTVAAGGTRNASTTILYGTVGGATTSAPGKTAVTNFNKQAKHGNYPKDAANGVDSFWLGSVSYYNPYYCINGLTTTLLNGAADLPLKLGYYYNNKHYNNNKQSTVYGVVVTAVDAVTGTITQSGVSTSFGRDDAFGSTNGGEFVFIPAGKLPSQNAGNNKYYTYSNKTNG